MLWIRMYPSDTGSFLDNFQLPTMTPAQDSAASMESSAPKVSPLSA